MERLGVRLSGIPPVAALQNSWLQRGEGLLSFVKLLEYFSASELITGCWEVSKVRYRSFNRCYDSLVLKHLTVFLCGG